MQKNGQIRMGLISIYVKNNLRNASFLYSMVKIQGYFYALMVEIQTYFNEFMVKIQVSRNLLICLSSLLARFVLLYFRYFVRLF